MYVKKHLKHFFVIIALSSLISTHNSYANVASQMFESLIDLCGDGKSEPTSKGCWPTGDRTSSDTGNALVITGAVTLGATVLSGATYLIGKALASRHAMIENYIDKLLRYLNLHLQELYRQKPHISFGRYFKRQWRIFERLRESIRLYKR